MGFGRADGLAECAWGDILSMVVTKVWMRKANLLEAPAKTAEDGRTIRRDRNIDRVMDAALALFAQERGVPAIDAIARRAGLSTRSLYRYFDDAASLYFTVAQHRLAQIEAQAQAPVDLTTPTEARAAALAQWRWPMNDELRNIGDAIRPFQDSNRAIGDLRRSGSQFIAGYVESCFRPELDRMEKERDSVLMALRVLWSVESWSVLSFDLGRDQQRVSGVVIDATLRLLRD